MLKQKLILDDTINNEIINDYVAVEYNILYKDKYKREAETSINHNTKPKYLRFAYQHDPKNEVLHNLILPTNKRLMLMPYIPIKSQQDRCMMYLAASSGAGKSYFVNQYCELYHGLHKGRNRILFFTMNDFKADRSLNHDLYDFVDMKIFLEHFKDEENIREFETSHEYDNSMFVFDDIGSLTGQDEKTIWSIINIILEFKRKNLISAIIISHIPTLGHLTKLLIREIRNYVIFPANLQVKSDRLLNNYLGLSKKQIDKITNEDYENSLWVSIDTKRRIVITQNTEYFL